MRQAVQIFFILLFSCLALFAQDTSITHHKIIENGKEFYLYEVQESEGFMAIGRKFGLAYKDIIDANIQATQDGLRAGQIIKVPIIEGRNTDAQEIKTDQFLYHIVEAGETLFFISRKYDTSVKDIVTHNPEAGGILSVGMELKIPKKVAEQAKEEFMPIVTVAKKDTFNYYTVQPGETAYGIARKHKVTVEDLAKANPALETSKLAVGSQLRIPKIKKEQPKLITPKLTDTRYIYHRVKTGENLESIASLYTIPTSVIIKTNQLQDELPPEGYMLRVPHSYQYSKEVSQESTSSYTVKKNDKLDAIAQALHVPIEAIKTANPQVRNWDKLKKGSTLAIPSLTVEVVDTLINNLPEHQRREDLANYFSNKEAKSDDTLRVAIIWPLFLEHNSTINELIKIDAQTNDTTITIRDPKIIEPAKPMYREFYFGALLALNDLKQKGLTIKLSNYDSKKSLTDILRILEDSTLLEQDIIIGPATYRQAKPVSDFCMENHIRLVLPFLSNFKDLEINPYLFQVAPASWVENKHVAQEVAKRYASSNIILVKGKSGDKREVNFTNELKTELYRPDSLWTRDITYKEINYNKDRMGGLSALLRKDMHNLIIIPAKKEKLYTLVVPVMENYISKNKEVDIKLLGFSEWQRFEGRELENIFNVGCEIYSPFYANIDSEDPKMVKFKTDFHNYFNTYPTWNFPYYGMLSYDIVSYFMKGLHEFGNEFESNLNKVDNDGLCVDLNFERVNNWGGFVNTTFHTLDYTRNFDIELVEASDSTATHLD